MIGNASARPIQETIAEELLRLARRIEEATVALCRDDHVCREHGTSLQAFDEIAQTQALLARLLLAGNSENVPITLDALAARIK